MPPTNDSSQSAQRETQGPPEQNRPIERVHLNQAQSKALVEALLSPKKPNKKLKLAMQEYRQRVESR